MSLVMVCHNVWKNLLHSDRYLLRLYASGTVLDVGDIEVNSSEKVLTLMVLKVLCRKTVII